MKDQNGIEYEECVVGNVIGPHEWGKQHEIKYSTKYFSSGTKVYCIFMYSGMGNERIRVFGKARQSSRMIDIVISEAYIINRRIQKVYDKKVIRFLKKYAAVNTKDFVEVVRQNELVRELYKIS